MLHRPHTQRADGFFFCFLRNLRSQILGFRFKITRRRRFWPYAIGSLQVIEHCHAAIRDTRLGSVDSGDSSVDEIVERCW